MKKFTSIFKTMIPAPSSAERIRQQGILVLTAPGAELPPGFPENIVREKIFKESGSVAAFQCGNGGYFCKIYKYRGFFHSLKRTFRTPRAFRCFSGAQLLAEHGFQTPVPIAAAVRRKGIIPLSQLLLTGTLPEGTLYLDKKIRETDLRAAGKLLCERAAFAAKLHRKGFVHGDMSLRNFYALTEPGNFGLIDLDGIRHYPQAIPRKMAVKELARLISSAFRCREKDPVPQEDWLHDALQSYRQNGGADLRPEELRPVLARLLKHRAHPVWEGKSL